MAIVTPVEERIDHDEAKRIACVMRYNDDVAGEPSPIAHLARAYLDLLTEHSAREETIQQAEAALRWNVEYAGKMVWMCPSFVYVERESRAAIDLLRSRAAK